ncbi:hypothetical protein PLUTE_a3022 [Pseudoalteromonas luteoviolacea DSM 6061]|nr:hypothetical protein [Pseudoalteromonas luteoviolacea DSM 6061]
MDNDPKFTSSALENCSFEKCINSSVLSPKDCTLPVVERFIRRYRKEVLGLYLLSHITRFATMHR